jgi:hypothetical protein
MKRRQPRFPHRIFTTLAICAGLVGPLAAAFGDTKPPPAPRPPFAWGILTPAKACVIFREYTTTKVGFWVVAVTAKTHAVR